MTGVRLRVVSAGPLVTFQDAGRPGRMRFGVPASGPMDRLAHAAANVAVGANAGATAIEVSMGGLALEVDAGDLSIAVAGGEFTVTRNDVAHASWSVVTLHRGDRLRVAPGRAGRWAYVAVDGVFDVPQWLGSAATHSMSGFGGGALHDGDLIDVADARARPDRNGPLPRPPERPTARVRVVMGPQDRHVAAASLDAFQTEPFAVTDSADRMGVRLDGPRLALTSSLSIPSEPVVRGSVQVAGDGVATVLLADHQTTGGYPKIATVISADLDAVTQLRPPATVSFVPITPGAAIEAARSHVANTASYLDALVQPSLAERLASENLISEAPTTD